MLVLVGLCCSGGSQSRSAELPPTATGDAELSFRDELLNQRAGFGRNATGGYSGPVFYVGTDADSGAGSLREALTGNDPRWIIFDGNYTIRLASGIEVGSNKTIDGRGFRVTLTGHNQAGLILNGVTNIIIENLILTDFGDTEKTKHNNPYDAIALSDAHQIWIDHCDLSKAGDKLIGITAGATDITVSWNRFHDQEQVFQIGCMANRDVDVFQTVTSHHNFFDHTGYRHPVVSYGKLHAYNNYIVGWKLWGIKSQRIAQAYLQSNIFEAGERNNRAALFKPQGNGWNDAHTRQDIRPGYLKSEGNLVLNRAKIRENQPELVFDPARYYTVAIEEATPGLAAVVAAKAGWQPACEKTR